MDIQSASMNMAQANVREEAAIRVGAMGLDAMKAQSAALTKLMESAPVVNDPNRGRNVDLIA
ncbi:MAG: YjfB family protein [Spirochaetaceae bacterium]|nr:YjfB family protein [Spirochaetaceae bacterium]